MSNVENRSTADVCRCVQLTHRSNDFTDEDGGGLPVAGGAWDHPLAVELQKKLGARMNVHTRTMLPGNIFDLFTLTSHDQFKGQMDKFL